MDPNSRTITLASIAVLGLAVLAIVIAVLVPFKVKQSATIQNIIGTAEMVPPGQTSAGSDPDEVLPFKAGQTIKLQPASSARVTFELNGGHATITGPARVALVNSYRHATLLAHILDSDQFERQYNLTIEQTLGIVQYNFSGTNPPFKDVVITIRLPDGNYQPTTPCWEIMVSASGEAETNLVECPN